jgi:hypothetical protein
MADIYVSPLYKEPLAQADSVDFLPEDSEIWAHLKQAIATSSGFQRWEQERDADPQFTGLSLEHRIRRYLRETLETLAY